MTVPIWERGSNENFNGLLRQFFPKSRDFSTITQKELDLAVNLLNTRPRKRHGYKNPAELIKPYLSVAI
ncbi:IS30 family transposase [Candidatus Saccharibacteria bacterium]|nr:IS30 family transposase [Candidatus Saccharibacteria bacterium]